MATTTLTKRVSGPITEDSTSRVPTAATADTTKRVSGAITANSNNRVAIVGAGIGGDAWGNSWGFFAQLPGKVWGNTWSSINFQSAVKPAVDTTQRISGAPGVDTTKRVPETPSDSEFV